MKKDYIYINLYSDKNVSQNSLKIMLKDNCNKIVFKGITNNLGKIKIPICDNELYNLIIYSNIIIIVPLIARKDKIYCVNIDNNKDEILNIISSVESCSIHLVAKIITNYYKEHNKKVNKWVER